jgi:hypothetical protein
MAGKKKEIHESNGDNEISGFGDNVVKLKDKDTGEVVAFIGTQNGEERVYFPKAITFEQVEAVSELLGRKKLQKHLHRERFEKAQAYADKKFGG